VSNYYEVIFENGDHSILQSDTDDEVVNFAKEHHRRATAGEPGGPTGEPATRIVRILAYDNDPADVSHTLSKDVAKSTIAEATKLATDDNGVVDLDELQHALDPPVIVDTDPHESNYLAEQAGELDSSLWTGGK
jgi:hypothetical protein